MKKAVIAVMAVIITLTAAFMVSGCTDEAMQTQIDSLIDRVEDLENKNNVFWTDKGEYAETETMTVYFKDTAVYEISLSFASSYKTAFADSGDHLVVNGVVYIKSLIADIYATTVISTSYLISDSTSYTCSTGNYTTILRKDEKTTVVCQYKSVVELSKNASYDFVICIPGTPVELARFIDVSVYVID